MSIMVKEKDSAQDTLVVANPGTGKTTALAGQVVKLLKEGAKEEDILCITFTTKAAEEMRQRVSRAIRESGIDAKPQNIDIHTFHSYAFDYLQERGEEREVATNNYTRYSIYRSFKSLEAMNYQDDYIIGEIVPKCENAIRYLKSFGILPEQIRLHEAEKELEKVYEEEEIANISIEENKKFLEYFVNAFSSYEHEKNSSGRYLDYNDMLMEFVKRYDRKARHYKFVLVDELQDVNELEADIAVASGDSLFLVGDRKQAIFGFQGGSVENFRRFIERKGIKKETKTLNYRSLQGILDYSKTHFLANTTDMSYKEELEGLKGKREGEARIRVITSKDQNRAAISRLIDIIEKQKDSERSAAIITRTNGQIVALSKMLDAKGIDYTTTVGGSTNREAKEEIIAYMRGLLFDDADDVVGALFTPFSGISLKQAFEISERIKGARQEGMEFARKTATEFFRTKELLTLDKLPLLFLDRIMPISVSIGKEYYLTASAVYENVTEFFGIARSPDRKALFDYLAITEESYEAVEKKHRVTLTTVHKAKGREFDAVVYLPKDVRGSLSFIDVVVYSIIKTAKGIDIREGLEEEHLRVDFVAFTRAKDELYIVAGKEKLAQRYHIEGLSESEVDEAEQGKEPLSWKYDEAYSMFVAGRKDDARKKLTEKDDWLREKIADFFRNKDRLSFSLIDASMDPYGFLKSHILGIKAPRGEGLRIGTDVHGLAEKRFNGTLDRKGIRKEYLPFFANIEKIDEEIRKKYDCVQIAAECELVKDLKDVFGCKEQGLAFKAQLDAVYEIKQGKGKKYLILDWKTDKNTGKASAHRQQLAVYRKIYALDKGVKEDEICTALGFVGLRGNINTGTTGYEIDDQDPKARQVETFEKHLQEYLKYRNDTEAFVKALLECKASDPFYQRICMELKR